MDTVLPKKQMSEEDIKRLFITPAIEQKWHRGHITMETHVTDGKVNIKGNRPVREKAKKVDYLLYLNKNNPIAVVEAKDNTHSIAAGMQQAMGYAQMLDLPFAYSSNGDGFLEHDFTTGRETYLAMDEFPTEQELTARFLAAQNGGQGITPAQRKILDEPYYSAMGVHSPRYYQRIAVNRTLAAIAAGRQRLLLAMATGTGKTYTAFQIVHRLLKSGMKHKVLYLADRNFLVDTTMAQDFRPLEKVTHKIIVQKEDPATTSSYQMYFALYQQLVGDDGAEHYSRLFSPDFFDLVIVDECHRGSAKEESRWRRILEYFSPATQIGMTATPKETSYVSNIDYFGEPVYTYSLNQGIEDGFLAPFRVVSPFLNISDGWRPTKGQRDKFGEVIEDRIYSNSDYDYHIILEDRTREVAANITEFLRRHCRMSKTIVFCANEDAAERMRVELVNQNADMVQQNPDYVVRITGSDDYGKGKLKYFLSKQPFPVIATTSKLLSTGADSKMTKLIVLDQMIGSMTEFKQIIGRGTRLLYDEGKTHFTVMDFRRVSRLFADPDWDGPVEQVDGFGPSAPKPPDAGADDDGAGALGEDDDTPPPHEHRPKPIVTADGCRVELMFQTVSVYDAGGRLLRQENITDYTKSNILDEFATLQDFIASWTAAEKKEPIRAMLRSRGIDLESIKAEHGMQGVDDYDFICHVAFDSKPLTRRERAENVRRRDFFGKYGPAAREVLEALLDRYMNSGIYEVEDISVLKLDPFRQKGSPSHIVKLFGSKDQYRQALRELENAIYLPS
ncbi:MAG: DEAD/DEAH box helicase family protein [Akkermansia sp.]|nr:DEAD/DEAH box helicase family protein [Akkermansia sp.]